MRSLFIFTICFITFTSSFGQSENDNNKILERRVTSAAITYINDYHRVLSFSKSSDYDNFENFFPLKKEANIINTNSASETFNQSISYIDFSQNIRDLKPTRSSVNAEILDIRNVNFISNIEGTIEMIVKRNDKYFFKSEKVNLLDESNKKELVPYEAAYKLLYKLKFKIKNNPKKGQMGLRSASNNSVEFVEISEISKLEEPKTSIVYIPTFKNNFILIDNYKTYFKTEVQGINFAWLYEELNKNDLTDDFRSKKSKDIKPGLKYVPLTRKQNIFAAIYLPPADINNNLIESQSSNNQAFNLIVLDLLIVNPESKFKISLGGGISFLSGENTISFTNFTRSFNTIDPDNYPYLRRISINSFEETISQDGVVLSPQASITFNLTPKFSIRPLAIYNISNISFKSNRNANITYSGYYDDLYGVEFFDGIYDFGTFDVTQNSDLNLTMVTELQLGVMLSYSISKSVSLGLKIMQPTEYELSDDKLPYFSIDNSNLNSIFETQNIKLKSNIASIGVVLKL